MKPEDIKKKKKNYILRCKAIFIFVLLLLFVLSALGFFAVYFPNIVLERWFTTLNHTDLRRASLKDRLQGTPLLSPQATKRAGCFPSLAPGLCQASSELLPSPAAQRTADA